MPLLQLKNVTVQFGGLTALSNLDLTIEKGNIHGLIGPNGAGKSTVFNCISRYYTPTAGEICFSDENLLSLKPYQVIEKGIARTFQNLELFQNLTVLENVLIGYHTKLKAGFFASGLKLPSSKRFEFEAKKKAIKILNYLELENEKDTLISNLPYGYQKKVEIARALVNEPDLILLDEPAAGLNSNETDRLIHLLQDIRAEFDMTMVLVEHDMSMVMKLCDSITVIEFGKKIADGTPDEIKVNPRVIAAYLGEVDSDASI